VHVDDEARKAQEEESNARMKAREQEELAEHERRQQVKAEENRDRQIRQGVISETQESEESE
jgi:hypothetical protein